MGTDNSENKDDFTVELNETVPPPPEGMTYASVDGKRVLSEDGSQPPLSKRPGKSASRSDWVDYAVSLGADRHYLENDTEHIVDATPGSEVVETHDLLSVSDIKDLAERLGG
jgi:hypothetical protein